ANPPRAPRAGFSAATEISPPTICPGPDLRFPGLKGKAVPCRTALFAGPQAAFDRPRRARSAVDARRSLARRSAQQNRRSDPGMRRERVARNLRRARSPLEFPPVTTAVDDAPSPRPRMSPADDTFDVRH